MSTSQDAVSAISKSIQTVVDKRLEQAGFDKSIKAKITGIVSEGKYNIKYNGNEYTASSTSVHAVNDMVNVIIPQNNYSNMYIVPLGITPNMTLPANGGNSDTVNYHTVESDVPANAYFLTETDILRLSGYVHDQIQSSTTWTINHPLNKYPSVTIVDSSGNVVIGDIKYISVSQVEITFSYEFSGKAYLN